MTAVITDTDILSTFGKIGRLDLLQLLFEKMYSAPAVSRELWRTAQRGFVWVASAYRAVVMLPLTEDENKEVERLATLYPQLGSGEIESFVLAQLLRTRQGSTLGVCCGRNSHGRRDLPCL